MKLKKNILTQKKKGRSQKEVIYALIVRSSHDGARDLIFISFLPFLLRTLNAIMLSVALNQNQQIELTINYFVIMNILD